MAQFDKLAFFYDFGMKHMKFYKVSRLLRYLQPSATDKVVDIGGGTGYLAAQIQQQSGCRITVVDESPKMLRRAAMRGNVETCLASALNTPFADNTFSAMLCTDALHHIRNFPKLFKEISRILKPDGRVVIQEFRVDSFFGKFIYWLEKIVFGNSHFLSPKELTDMLAEYNIVGETSSVSSYEYIFVGKVVK